MEFQNFRILNKYVKLIISGTDGIPGSKVEEYLHSAMEKCDSRVEGSGGFKEVIREWLSTSLMTMTDLAQVVNEAPFMPKEKVYIEFP